MEEDPQSLRMWFDSVDTDQSNSINVEELQVSSFLAFPFLANLMLECTIVVGFQLWRKQLLALPALIYLREDKFLS